MDLKKLSEKAKGLVEKRGGTDSLKEDAQELQGIAKGKGSFTDKAKAAVAAIKDPGDEDTARPAPAADSAAAAEDPAAQAGRTKDTGDKKARGKHGGGGHGRGGRRGRRDAGDGDASV